MKIALLGSRGVPANYGGFETCAEQLGQRLAKRGHDVTVYCRSPQIAYPHDTYKGMKLVKLPTITNKYLDTIAHTFISSLHALRHGYDVILYFGAGNSPTTWIPRIVGTKTLLNVNGLDWKREKWPPVAKKYIQFAEYLATKLPTRFLTDSHVVQDYYKNKFGVKPPYIAYGSEVERVPAGETLAKYNIEPGKYILFVGRLVAENYVDHLVDAFRQLDTDYKCVIVGGAAYADDYIALLKEKAQGDPRIVFTGYVFGKGYHEFGSHAPIFVESSGVGGTHPALIEAMNFGNCVIVYNTAENLETIGDAGLSYDGKVGAESLREVLQDLLDNPDKVTHYRQAASQRAQAYYTWESVTDAYERLFFELCDKPMPTRLIEFDQQMVTP